MYTDVFAQAFIHPLAAVIAVPPAKRLGLGSGPGYLLAGFAMGPAVLGLVGAEGQDVMHFAEWGVGLMLFPVGLELELEPSVLWLMRTPIIGLGGLQVGVTASLVGLITCFLGLAWQSALVAGLILSLSSTAIVM